MTLKQALQKYDIKRIINIYGKPCFSTKVIMHGNIETSISIEWDEIAGYYYLIIQKFDYSKRKPNGETVGTLQIIKQLDFD